MRVDDVAAVMNHSPAWVGTKFKYGKRSCATFVLEALEAGGANVSHINPNIKHGSFWDDILRDLHTLD